jgi:small subunit ribosomal protein S13
MARIAGVDIPDNKRGEISLTYIFGIGKRSAQKILTEASVSLDKQVKDWNDDESNLIRSIIAEKFRIEGSLKSEIQMSIKRLLDIGCYPNPRVAGLVDAVYDAL